MRGRRVLVAQPPDISRPARSPARGRQHERQAAARPAVARRAALEDVRKMLTEPARRRNVSGSCCRTGRGWCCRVRGACAGRCVAGCRIARIAGSEGRRPVATRRRQRSVTPRAGGLRRGSATGTATDRRDEVDRQDASCCERGSEPRLLQASDATRCRQRRSRSRRVTGHTRGEARPIRRASLRRAYPNRQRACVCVVGSLWLREFQPDGTHGVLARKGNAGRADGFPRLLPTFRAARAQGGGEY